jgi:hypothetical protein
LFWSTMSPIRLFLSAALSMVCKYIIRQTVDKGFKKPHFKSEANFRPGIEVESPQPLGKWGGGEDLKRLPARSRKLALA